MNWEFIRGVGAINWLYRTAIRQIAKRLFKKGVSLRLPIGLTLKIPMRSHHGTEVFITRADTDWGSEALFCKFANRDSDFFDIGANIGYYSLYLSPLVRKVYAFEPDSQNFGGLRDNISSTGNIEHVPMAISDRNGIVHLDVFTDGAVSSISEYPGAGSIAVEAVTIDQFAARHPDSRVGLIKIDIEGHDVAALEGGRETVAEHQPLILIEFGQGDPIAEFNNPSRLTAFCEPLGYAIFAYTHFQPGRYRNVLVHLGIDDFATTRLKMLFLVPGHLRHEFSEMAER
jgi:FkbM family methyltransferase